MADWTEQAEQMLKTWTEAQKNVWDSWQDLADRAVGTQPKPQAFAMNPMEWFQQSMSLWTDPAGVARAVVISRMNWERSHGSGMIRHGAASDAEISRVLITAACCVVVAAQAAPGVNTSSLLNVFDKAKFHYTILLANQLASWFASWSATC